MRRLIGSKAYIALTAAVMLAAGVAHAQSAPQTPAPGTTAPVTGGDGQTANPNTTGEAPTPARPRVRRSSNFFGLPILAPLLGLAGAGAAVAATSGGNEVPPASPQ